MAPTRPPSPPGHRAVRPRQRAGQGSCTEQVAFRSDRRELTATVYPVDATAALAVAESDATEDFASPEVIVTPAA
jgi:hypothetical protein